MAKNNGGGGLFLLAAAAIAWWMRSGNDKESKSESVTQTQPQHNPVKTYSSQSKKRPVQRPTQRPAARKHYPSSRSLSNDEVWKMKQDEIERNSRAGWTKGDGSPYRNG